MSDIVKMIEEQLNEVADYNKDGCSYVSVCVVAKRKTPCGHCRPLLALKEIAELHDEMECWERYRDETPITFLLCRECSDHETEHIVPFPCPTRSIIEKMWEGK